MSATPLAASRSVGRRRPAAAAFAPSAAPGAVQRARIDDQRKDERREWLESLSHSRLIGADRLRCTILHYLYSAGHIEAAELFAAEAPVPAACRGLPGESAEQAAARARLAQAVRSGQIEAAVELVNSAWPELLDSRPELSFRMRQQQLLELIRQSRLSDALEFAHSNLAELVSDRPHLLKDLEECMALLAFERPSDCAFGQWLGLGQRDRLASELNSAVLDSEGLESGTELDFLLRTLVWGQDSLAAAGVSFPRMRSLPDAALSDC